MHQNESNPLLRVITDQLFAADGTTPLPGNTVFVAGDLKLIKSDGTVGNAAHLPVGVAGAVAGTFKFQLDQSEISQLGTMHLQISKPGVVEDWDWPERIVPDPAVTFWQTLRAGNQPVGSFGEILDAHISAIVAQHIAATVAPAKPYSLIVGDLEPDMPLTALELDGTPANLSTAQSIQLRWSKPGVAAALVALAAVDLPTGQMKRVWGAGDTDIIGVHRGQIVVTTANGEITTYPRDGTHYTWTVYPVIA